MNTLTRKYPFFIIICFCYSVREHRASLKKPHLHPFLFLAKLFTSLQVPYTVLRLRQLKICTYTYLLPSGFHSNDSFVISD